MKIVMRVERGVVAGNIQKVLVVDLPAVDTLDGYNDGSIVVADVKGARNPKQHNLWWVLMEFVAQNHPEITDKNKAALECKIALELFDWHIDRQGGGSRIMRSIAADAMEQGVFNEFFKRTVDWVCREMGNTAEEVMEALYFLIGDKRYSDVLDRAYQHVVGRKRR